MDLVERYLGAVRWNLPAAKADDILAELRDLIGARIEDREEELDRPLTQGELSALLKEFGHPLAVASGYRQHQVLIGPELFPFYLFSLQVVLLISAAILTVMTVAQALASDRAVIQAVIQELSVASWTLLSYGALVTLIFAVLERTGWLRDYLHNWTPEKLPELRVKPKHAWETVFEIGVDFAFLLWWAGMFALPVSVGTHGVRLEPMPIWDILYWPIFALIAAHLLHKLVQLLRPNWTTARAALVVGTTAGGIALLAVLHQAGRLVTVFSDRTPEGTARVQASLDHIFFWAVIGVGVIWVLQCLGELWRIARSKR